MIPNNEHGVSLNLQASNAVAVTPHDSTNLTHTSTIYVGTTGDVSVQMSGTGTAIVFVGVPAGSFLPILVTRVNSTATDASDIVALY